MTFGIGSSLWKCRETPKVSWMLQEQANSVKLCNYAIQFSTCNLLSRTGLSGLVVASNRRNARAEEIPLRCSKYLPECLTALAVAAENGAEGFREV